jgi:hypothetical protein
VGLAQHDGARGVGESHTIEGQRLEVNDSVSMPCQSGNGGLKLDISLGLGKRSAPGFQVVIMPSRLLLRIASSEDSTIATKRCAERSASLRSVI